VGPAHERVADHPDPENAAVAHHTDPNLELRICGKPWSLSVQWPN
jgi:hypothetical protein